MLAWIVLAATTPAMLCLGASAFLAYRDKAQWIWFAAFSRVAGFGGLTVLQTIGAWRLAAQGRPRLFSPRKTPRHRRRGEVREETAPERSRRGKDLAMIRHIKV